MRCLILLAGSSSCSRPARCALRMRVSRSAIGSVTWTTSGLPFPEGARKLDVELPRRLDHSRDLALQGAVAEADAAHLELVQEGAAPPADGAAVVGPHLELRLALEPFRLGDLGQLGHERDPLRGTEGHAHVAQERPTFLVVVGSGHDGDVHAFDLLDLVVVDLGKDDLLLDAERVIALPVERLRRYALEVAHPRQRDAHQAIEELVHAVLAQRHHAADGLVLAQLEVGDALARAGDHGLWPVIRIICSSACSISLLLLIASPRPMLTTIFSIFGTCMGFL